MREEYEKTGDKSLLATLKVCMPNEPCKEPYYTQKRPTDMGYLQAAKTPPTVPMSGAQTPKSQMSLPGACVRACVRVCACNQVPNVAPRCARACVRAYHTNQVPNVAPSIGHDVRECLGSRQPQKKVI